MKDKQRVWSRDETIVAFNLYCKVPFSQTTKNNPLIIEYANKLGRTPSAMSMKIGNLGRLDPILKQRGISGLANGSKLDEEIWNEFHDDWNKLAFESERIVAELNGSSVENEPFNEQIDIPQGLNKERVVRVRVNQAFFRSTVMAAYGRKCCITGLNVPELLIASHIIPWSESESTRTDPRNGLLLNSIHDKAFDTGLITITEEYVVKISTSLSESFPDELIQKWFTDFDGSTINLPDKFMPSKEYLKWHNDNVFRG